MHITPKMKKLASKHPKTAQKIKPKVGAVHSLDKEVTEAPDYYAKGIEESSRECLVKKSSRMNKDITLIKQEINVIFVFLIATLGLVCWSVYAR